MFGNNAVFEDQVFIRHVFRMTHCSRETAQYICQSYVTQGPYVTDLWALKATKVNFNKTVIATLSDLGN